MNKKLIVLVIMATSFGLQAMHTLPSKKRRLPNSPMPQSIAFTPEAYQAVRNDTSIARPKACKFPHDYATREFVTSAEWELLPPAEQKKWMFDEYTPDEITNFDDVPESTKMGHRIRIEVVREKFRLHQERHGFVNITTLNGGTHE